MIPILKRCALIASVVFLSGCMAAVQPMESASLPPTTLTSGMMAATKEAVASQLKDPYSAQYENLRAYRKDVATFAICGRVNAKNSYGGYVGSVPFIAYVGAGANQKAGQYFPINATVFEGTNENFFYQLIPLCAP
jgi:hypothetical protein